MRLLVISQVNKKIFIGIKRKIVCLPIDTTGDATLQEYSCDLLTETASAQSITLDQDEKYLIATFDDKHVCCWDISTGALMGSLLLKKKPTSMVSANWGPEPSKVSPLVIFADKAGDIFASKLPELSKEVLVAGHTASIVLELSLLSSHRLIASADRDEKIRVSSFPDLETIVSYCLGHTSVVSSVSTFSTSSGKALMVTAGWDHQIILWDMLSGQSLDTIVLSKSIPTPIVKNAQIEGEEEEDDEDEAQEGDTTEKPETDVIAEGGGEGGEEEETKQYNEKDAGHYPFKVLACVQPSKEQAKDLVFISAIFKDENHIRLYSLQSSATEHKLSFSTDIVLPANPLDLAVYQNEYLLVLLPSPHLLAIYHITPGTQEGTLTVTEVTNSLVKVEIVQAIASLAGEQFHQGIVSAGLGFEDEATGMKKHALNRPYSEEVINYAAKKGSKRSNKRRKE